MTLIILPLVAVFTSIVSGIIGMGGGVLLLTIMTFFLPYQVIVPIHGIVQFISNSSRGFALAKYVNWNFVGFFVLGAPFGYILAYSILKHIHNPDLYYLLLALFILYVIFKPKNLPEIRLKGLQWSLLGLFAGLMGSILGATGPLIAIFYVRSDLDKKEIVATKAMQQLFIHLFKIPLFISLDFHYLEHLSLMSAMSLSAIVGTLIGVRVLHFVNAQLFVKLYKSVLFIAALRLIFKFVQGFL